MNKSGFQLTLIAVLVIMASIGMAAILSGLTPEGDYIPTDDEGSSSVTDSGDEIPEGGNEDTGSKPSTQTVKGGIKGGNEDALQSGRMPGYEDKEINSDPDTFIYRFSSDITLETPEAPGSIMVENDPGNSCPMQLCYYMEDTEELIYVSPMIYPDEHIETDTLSKKLKKGEYKVNAVISVYDDATMELKTTFHEEVTLTVNQKFLGIF